MWIGWLICYLPGGSSELFICAALTIAVFIDFFVGCDVG
jgi:hypothetical protein